MSDESRSILIEYLHVGNAMEVRAVDEQDGLEVSFIAPEHTLESDVKRLARRKLDYVRRKRAQKDDSSKETAQRDNRRGIIV